VNSEQWEGMKKRHKDKRQATREEMGIYKVLPTANDILLWQKPGEPQAATTGWQDRSPNYSTCG